MGAKCLISMGNLTRIADLFTDSGFIEPISEKPGRLVTQISEVLGYEDGRYQLKPIQDLIYEVA